MPVSTAFTSSGRPNGYDEPTVKRHFDLPESLNERLVNHSKRTKKAAVRIVQDALERMLAPDAKAGESNGYIIQGDADASPLFDSHNLEVTLRSVLSDVLVHSVPVSVDRVRRVRLEKLAQDFGFADERDLLQDLAFRALENPKAAESFLFSQLEQASAATVAAENEPQRSASSKPRKKAA